MKKKDNYRDLKKKTNDLMSVLDSYHSSLLHMKVYIIYNLLIIFSLILYILYCFVNIKQEWAFVWYIIVGLLFLNDAISVRLKKQEKENLYKLFADSLEAVRQLGDTLEWGENRRKFFDQIPYDASKAINRFFTITQSKCSPCRKGFNYFNLLSIINILVVLIACIVTIAHNFSYMWC